MEYKVRLEREKETKNKVRFAEVPDPGLPQVLQTVYIPKRIAGDARQIKVIVRIET